MTAMIRGFDQSLREMISAIGPNTIFIQRFGISSVAGGAEFKELLKRPNLSISDARAIEEHLISRKADTEFTFDVDLALKQNDENPVFYVQYAHARICSILRRAGDPAAAAPGDPQPPEPAVGNVIAASVILVFFSASTSLVRVSFSFSSSSFR